MWFAQDGTDYVANLSSTGITHVEKATFTDPRKFSRKHTKQEENNSASIEIDKEIDF